MLITAVAATGLTIYFLYHAALREVSARLSEMAFIRAKFIESIAREKENTHPQNSLEWFQAVVGQVAEAHRLYTETGSAADLVVATIREGNIIWISRGNTADLPATTPLTSRLAEPMRRALAGQSGVMEAPDYRDERVLAAYMPALDGNLGVVAKMDMAQVRAPFIRAASLALGLMLAMAAAGALVFLFPGRPDSPPHRTGRGQDPSGKIQIRIPVGNYSPGRSSGLIAGEPGVLPTRVLPISPVMPRMKSERGKTGFIWLFPMMSVDMKRRPTGPEN